MSDEPKEQTVGGLIDGMPWWVKAALVVYNTAGLPTMLLVYYLMQDSGVIPSPIEKRLADIEAGMQQDAGHAIRHDTTMQEMVKVVQDQNKRWEEADKRRQVWCVLKATTDAEKKACLTAGDK